jgi:hypothetical protein
LESEVDFIRESAGRKPLSPADAVTRGAKFAVGEHVSVTFGDHGVFGGVIKACYIVFDHEAEAQAVVYEATFEADDTTSLLRSKSILSSGWNLPGVIVTKADYAEAEKKKVVDKPVDPAKKQPVSSSAKRKKEADNPASVDEIIDAEPSPPKKAKTSVGPSSLIHSSLGSWTGREFSIDTSALNSGPIDVSLPPHGSDDDDIVVEPEDDQGDKENTVTTTDVVMNGNTVKASSHGTSKNKGTSCSATSSSSSTAVKKEKLEVSTSQASSKLRFFHFLAVT